MNKPERTMYDVLLLAVFALAIAVAVQLFASSCAKTKATTVNVSGETSTVSVNQTGGVTAGVVNGNDE